MEADPIQISSSLFPSLFNTSTVNPREYQTAIFQRAQTENLMVVLPTGLGKTLIAALLSTYFLERWNGTQKVIFLAPTRPLINQHFISCQKMIKIPANKFAILTGQIQGDERIGLFNDAIILYMTPETLANDLEEGRYDVKQTALIIFDEAHRASGEYAYCKISKFYTQQNPEGRVLALTASPGSTPARIQEICNNLNINPTSIEYRNKKSDDVKEYVFTTDLLPVPVEMSPEMHTIHQQFSEILKHKVFQEIELLTILGLDGSVTPEKITQKYCLDLQTKLVAKMKDNGFGDGNPQAKQSRILMSMNAQVLKLFFLIKNLEAEGLPVVKQNLRDIVTKVENNKGSKADFYLLQEGRIRSIYDFLIELERRDPTKLIHPKILKLGQILQEQMYENPESRILIFTKYRSSVGMLVQKLGENPLFEVRKFVGQTKKSDSDKGMSQKAQIAMLDDFKRGDCNILVATNVAEEGLDIAECNMVVFYDNVGSEIRYIQRSGRTGRSSKGKIVMLFTMGTSDELSLKMAQIKAKRLQTQMQKIQNENNATNLSKNKTNTQTTLDGNNKEDNSSLSSFPKNSVLNSLSPSDCNTKSSNSPLITPEIPCKLLNSSKEPRIVLLIKNTIKESYHLDTFLPNHDHVVVHDAPYDLCVNVKDQLKVGIDLLSASFLELTPQNFSTHQRLLEKRRGISKGINFILLVDETQHELSSHLLYDELKSRLGMAIIPFKSISMFITILQAVWDHLHKS